MEFEELQDKLAKQEAAGRHREEKHFQYKQLWRQGIKKGCKLIREGKIEEGLKMLESEPAHADFKGLLNS